MNHIDISNMPVPEFHKLVKETDLATLELWLRDLKIIHNHIDTQIKLDPSGTLNTPEWMVSARSKMNYLSHKIATIGICLGLKGRRMKLLVFHTGGHHYSTALSGLGIADTISRMVELHNGYAVFSSMTEIPHDQIEKMSVIANHVFHE